MDPRTGPYASSRPSPPPPSLTNNIPLAENITLYFPPLKHHAYSRHAVCSSTVSWQDDVRGIRQTCSGMSLLKTILIHNGAAFGEFHSSPAFCCSCSALRIPCGFIQPTFLAWTPSRSSIPCYLPCTTVQSQFSTFAYPPPPGSSTFCTFHAQQFKANSVPSHTPPPPPPHQPPGTFHAHQVRLSPRPQLELMLHSSIIL
jgi:hypothetical protein